jgi:hypothetical protein
MEQRRIAAWVIIAAVVLISLCLLVPGFNGALRETLYCAFSGVQCVRVVP